MNCPLRKSKSLTAEIAEFAEKNHDFRLPCDLGALCG
jgi:hypothetical protein